MRNVSTRAAKSNLSRLVDPLLDAAGGDIALLRSAIENGKLTSLVQNLSDESNDSDVETNLIDTDN